MGTAQTPYMRAIMDALSPRHPASRVVFMKAAQVGATQAGNKWMGFCIHRAPGPAFFGIVFGDDETQASRVPVVQNAQGNEVEQFEPRPIAYARGGKDVRFNQPSSTAGICERNWVQMHLVASGFRVPYTLTTGDLSQYDFSSLRVDLNEIRRMVEPP